MANSKSNIYPVQLQGAELNLNKLDAEIKQYSGFNKNNAPFVGGCLSNIFTKDETIEGATSQNTYIAPNGDVYRVNTEGLWKNGEKVLDVDSSRLYDIEALDIKYNVVELFDEYAFVYVEVNTSNTFSYYLRYFDFNENAWHVEHLIDEARYSLVAFSLKRIKQGDNNYLWVVGCEKGNPENQNHALGNFFVFVSVLDNGVVKHGSYISSEVSESQRSDIKESVICVIHVVYNSVFNKFYIALFLSNASSNGYFVYVYSLALAIEENVILTVVNERNMRSIKGNDAPYYSYVNVSADDFVAESYRFYYFVTNSRVWLENYDARTKSIQQCDYKFIADNELGFKIEFLNPLYKESPEQGFHIRTYKIRKFGCLISVSHIDSAITPRDTTCYGYCDFATTAVTVVADVRSTRTLGWPHFNTGVVLNKVVLMNNEVVTGLTLPDTQRILVTDWNSVDESNIYLTNYLSRENYDFKDNSVVFYKANKKFYKLYRTNTPKLKLVNNQIVINCDMLKNSYRITDGAKLLFAPSWNNRVIGGTVTVRNTDVTENKFYIATSQNEYNLDNNASILLNPVPVINPIAIEIDNRNLNETLPGLINMYGADDPDIKYMGSSLTEDFSVNNYSVKDLEGLPFPIDTSGNVQYSPSLFSKVKSMYGNRALIESGNTYYPLMIGNNNELVMSFYLASGLDNFEEGFIIQGQFYGIINNGLYSVQYTNGVVGDVSFIVSVDGLQFIGNTPYEALFYSKTNRCLYSFIGANVLTAKQFVDKISEVRNYKYNPATQSIFLITDIGVIVYSLFGIYQIEFLNCQDMYLLNNGVILTDNEGTFKFVKYYKEETTEDYTKENIQLETMFYGMNNQTVTINDCLYMRIFSEEHEEGDLEVSATTLSLEGRMTEKTTFRIKERDWDKVTHTIYLRYQPKEQRGLGISFSINSPFKIASLSVGSQADAILVDKVSKGAINAPQRTSNNTEW